MITKTITFRRSRASRASRILLLIGFFGSAGCAVTGEDRAGVEIHPSSRPARFCDPVDIGSHCDDPGGGGGGGTSEPASALPDLLITASTCTGNTDGHVSISLTIKNQGTLKSPATRAGTTVRSQLSTGEWTTYTSALPSGATNVPELAPGQSATVGFTFSPTNCHYSDCTYGGSVDNQYQVEESSEGNNAFANRVCLR
jgi:hypothetical protein